MSWLSKILISLIAITLIGFRFINPDLKIDGVTVSLFILAAFPWLGSYVRLKSLKLPWVEFEFDKKESDETKKLSEPKVDTPIVESVPKFGIKPDDYVTRLIKLVPIEAIVLFIVCNAMIDSSNVAHRILYQWVLVVFLIVTYYFYSVFFLKISKFSHNFISAIGLLVWIFALGGPFLHLSWYTPIYGAIVLVCYVYVVPILEL